MTAPSSPVQLTVWPAEIEARRRAIELRQAEAEFAICDSLRRERLRLEVRLLTIELEA